tara:strand:- start:151 stop:618 length:468 start_codon:yes stop_codon:yes gene_type:complete
MYNDFKIFVIDNVSKPVLEKITDFIHSREQKHQNVQVTKLDFHDNLEAVLTTVRMHHEHQEVGKSLKVQVVLSKNHPVYKELREIAKKPSKHHLVYRTTEYITSKIKKSQKVEINNIKADDDLQLSKSNNKEKLERQTKPNLFFIRRNYGFRFVG